MCFKILFLFTKLKCVFHKTLNDFFFLLLLIHQRHNKQTKRKREEREREDRFAVVPLSSAIRHALAWSRCCCCWIFSSSFGTPTEEYVARENTRRFPHASREKKFGKISFAVKRRFFHFIGVRGLFSSSRQTQIDATCIYRERLSLSSSFRR